MTNKSKFVYELDKHEL